MASGTPPASSQIMRERDRFVAFAFCAADLLLELNTEGRVAYSAGATQALLERDPRSLMGYEFAEMVREEDRHRATEIVQSVMHGKRANDEPMKLRNGRKVYVSGYTSRKLNNHVFLAIRPAAEGDTNCGPAPARGGTDGQAGAATGCAPANPGAVADGPGSNPPAVAGAPAGERSQDQAPMPRLPANVKVVAQQFGDIVEDKLEALLKDGVEGELTMLELGGLGDLRDRMDAEKYDDLHNMIHGALQAVSVDGAAAGEIGDERFGVLHSAGLDVGELENEIAFMTREADPTGEGVAVRASTVTVDEDKLNNKDAVKAFVYTIQQLADSSNADVTLESLTEGLQETIQKNAKRIAQVKQAVSERAFEVAYQPIVWLHDRKIHHFESLVRLDREKVAMNPFEFITFSEETGLISDFDMRMAREVCMKLLRSLKAGQKPIPTAINISGRSLETPAFMSTLRQLLSSAPQLKGYVLFEITESSRIKDLEQGNNIIQGLRDDGFPVCLDDFGAGESAFEYLRALDVDHVKIDGSYMDFAVADPKGKAFLAAMAGLCKNLGISTIAEKIEDETLVPFLMQCGVDYGQGYYYGKPDTGMDLAAPQVDGAAATGPGPAAAASSPVTGPDRGQSWDGTGGAPPAAQPASAPAQKQQPRSPREQVW